MNARTATARDFQIAAQSKANQFWFYAIVAAIVAYNFGGWAVIPGLLALLSMIGSLHASKAADQLRNGTYPIPNLNNGAPDGDAANYGNEDKAE
jgi:hypothetical protein